MKPTRTGTIVGVNGNVITVQLNAAVHQAEVAYALLAGLRLKAEVLRVQDQQADLQVFESTDGLQAGDPVEFTGELLSADLGPGLLGQLYDGLQNPLHHLAEQEGFFLTRGVALPSLDLDQTWSFSPLARTGEVLEAGDTLGTVPERAIEHRIMVPFDWPGSWRLQSIGEAGSYRVNDPVATLKSEDGESRSATLAFRWPVRRPIRLYRERLAPTEPMITQIRIIDALFPIVRGGTYCIPGPFGAGKTVLQQITSRFAQVDLVIVAACGERAGEVVETIQEFPNLSDPRTGRSLMDRTIIICNTSSMPVAARESSVYTAVTLAEYYRQMGLHVLLLADSTSRWAQAMRERSGRLEEIPGEEAFPAYLQSVIAEFYERAGRVRLRDGRVGSVTIGGTVSPAGGNFDEPVTQATLKVVGAFHGLSRERADARRYPAIDPLESWSRYEGIISGPRRVRLRQRLARAHEIAQMMKVVGDEGVSLSDYVLMLKMEFLDQVFLQQNAFDPVDGATPAARQVALFDELEAILDASLSLPNREEARRFFNRLRLLLLDLNGMAWDSEACARQWKQIQSMWRERREPLATGEATESESFREALLETDLDGTVRRKDQMAPDSRRGLVLTDDHEEDHE